MIYCIKCGTQLPDDAQFCYKCGAKQQLAQQTQPAQDSGSNVIAPASIKELKCPSCGAPLDPTPNDATITCDYCGSTISLGSEGWKELKNHTMLFPNSFDQTIVQQTAVNWMDKGLFRWHMGEHTILKEITLSYIPYWIVPGSAMTNYVVQETAENVAGTLGTVAASALLSEAVTRGRGGPIIMMGTGQNITKSFQLRGDYQYPVVAVKGWAEFQPKYYEFDLKNRVPFDRKKIPHNFKIFNSDLSENAGMMTAKTSIEQLQAEKAHKQHRFGITSLKTDVTLAEPELLHAPIWYLKYLYKNKDQIIITIDANAMRVMQEIK